MQITDLEPLLEQVEKPARYVGGELGSIVKHPEIPVRMAFCFPDTYEIGMSHLGMKILYDIVNKMDVCWCERVFAPWIDFERQLQQSKIPLYSLESFTPLSDFDVIGFTLQYELSFTNILNMLHLGNVPVLAKERTELKNLVIAGGPCACNPEPLCDFIDLFQMGEGEEMLVEFIQLYDKAKRQKLSKKEFLRQAAQIPGIYVPSLYQVTYHSDGTIAQRKPLEDGIPEKITKRVVPNLDDAPYPKQFVVPFLQTVHDRAILEVLRGCIRGCRFCQAGFLYRPFREKSPSLLAQQGKTLCEQTGYEEMSLSSLSTSDYSALEELLNQLLEETERKRIALTLPSLRVDNFSDVLLKKIASVRKSGLTFAPEAGTQRLRDVINKNVTEEEVIRTCKIAFEGGYTAVKLYFMMGLPTESMEDIAGISELAQKVLDLFYSLPRRPRGKPSISVSAATFVPKPFTPFQWEPQDTREQIEEKQRHLLACTTSNKIRIHYHQMHTSLLEAVLARGDRRLGEVIYRAWKKGCYFDSWEECFYFDRWQEAFTECNLSMEFYANRRRDYEEILPWDFLDYGVSKEFFWRENLRAREGKTTPNCREQCSGCGANQFCEGRTCF